MLRDTCGRNVVNKMDTNRDVLELCNETPDAEKERLSSILWTASVDEEGLDEASQEERGASRYVTSEQRGKRPR